MYAKAAPTAARKSAKNAPQRRRSAPHRTRTQPPLRKWASIKAAKVAGIAPENLSRIFTLGFTTREVGHGFGLHTAATAAQEMRGSLTSASDGLGRGATFTLTVPICEHTEEDHAADSPLKQAA